VEGEPPMDAGTVNLEKVSVDIDNILSDIKNIYNDDMLNNINVPGDRVNRADFESACKIFGYRADK
jgi:hypothetical protein